MPPASPPCPVPETLSPAEALPLCRGLVGDRFEGRPAQGRGRGALRAEDAALYLAHVLHGAPLRRLAAVVGRPASAVLRAVRRVEARRDDPLLDDILTDLETAAACVAPSASAHAKEPALPNPRTAPRPGPVPQRDVPAPGAAAPRAPSATEVEKEAKRILRRLSEPRAFLALARGAQVACVFRKAEGALVTLARTPLEMAREFAARDWLACVHAGPAMARYEVSAVGRAWLKRTLEGDGDARRRAADAGFAEAATPFARQHRLASERWVEATGGATEAGLGGLIAVNGGESPLGWLARRRDADGTPFLAPEEVAAGERLREDFELAQMGPRVAQDWRRFLAPGSGGAPRGPAEGPAGARDRVARALAALGPGLEDAALRACCFLEGLEATERRMGWSARSGKVVLKIALGRLAEHYGFGRARERDETTDARRAAPPSGLGRASPRASGDAAA